MARTSGSLDRSLVHGLAWTGGVRWMAQLLSWGITIAVARILSPADYGLAGMAALWTGFTQLLCEAGLAASLLRRRDNDAEALAQLGGFAALLGVGCTLLSFLVARPISWAFGEPAVRGVVMVSGLGFLARGAQVLPRGLLAKRLDFRRLALIDGLEALTLSGATLVLALFGAGVWSLVVGGLVGGATGALLSFSWSPHRLAWPRELRRIASDVSFGSKVLGSQLAWYVYNNSDFAAVGRVLGAGPLGLYTLGWTLANVPVDRVSSLISRVTPAYIAAVSDDRPELRRYLLLLSEGLALFTFPACVGLALVANELVRTLLGPGWAGAVAPLRFLALVAAGRSLFVLAAPILNFTGQVDRNLRFSLLLALVLPPSFLLAAHWGITAVAAAWGVVYPLIAIGTLFTPALRAVGLRWRDYLGALRVPALATLVMTAAVLLVGRGSATLASPLARLVVEALTGAVVYTAMVLLLAHPRIRLVVAMLRGTLPPMEQERSAPAGPVPSRPRLVVVSYHFPPDPAVGGLRWSRLVRYAVQRGWSVEVIARDTGELPRLDAASARDLPDDVTVHRIPTPDLPIAASVDRIWSLLRPLRPPRDRPLAGHGPAADAPGSIGAAELRWRPRSVRDLARAYFAWLDHRRGVAWGRRAARIVRRCRDQGEIAALVSCGPPHTTHEMLRREAEQAGIPLVLDLRDPWSLLQRMPEATASPLWLALARREERRAVGAAALVVTCTEEHRDALRQVHPEAAARIITVRNGCDEPPAPPPRPRERFVVAYAGSVYIDRDPSPLFRAASRLIAALGLTPAEFAVEFMGEVAEYNGRPLTALAEEAGIGRHFRAHGARTRSEAAQFIAGASLLVLLPQDSDLAIPAKLFEYARCHASVLALVSATSATGNLLRGSTADVIAPDREAELFEALHRRFQAHQRGEIPPPLAADLRFHRGPQAAILFDALATVIRPPRTPVPEITPSWSVAAQSPK